MTPESNQELIDSLWRTYGSLEFEIPDKLTRDVLHNQLTHTLRDYVARRLIRSYLVVCDDKINPRVVANDNNLIAVVAWADPSGFALTHITLCATEYYKYKENLRRCAARIEDNS